MQSVCHHNKAPIINAIQNFFKAKSMVLRR
jgi:hypothetical protein